MATTTPRRSLRIPHQHTPRMSERKKGLFQSDSEASRDSLTKHRELTVVESESESDDELGIGALDSSSCDEDHNVPKTPVKNVWRTTRSQTNKLLTENNDLKNFMKSPFTLKKYQTRYSCPDSCSNSTPASPQVQNVLKTPSSTRSCNSRHTSSSTSSKARKSLANLIADTESCSSSLKDLNFDTDSASDSKENTPTKPLRRSSRRTKLTPKLMSFKGVLVEQKKNVTPIKDPSMTLTQMDMGKLSPSRMMKTPHNTSTDVISPPKLSHRRSVQVEESPESACESEKSNKRLHYDSKTDTGPNPKYPRLETSKARLSLFNLKEILSTKSFYGKTNPDLTTNVTAKISKAIETSSSHRRRLFPQSMKSKRRPGQINMGVRHRIRKPKALKTKEMKSTGYGYNSNVSQLNSTKSSGMNNSILSENNVSMLSNKNVSMTSQDSQETDNDKADPFDYEKQTIENLLSQWTEEDIPETEANTYKPCEVPCFSTAVIAETNQIFQPVTVVPVSGVSAPHNGTEFPDSIIIELGAQKALEQTQKDNSSTQKAGEKSQNVYVPQNDCITKVVTLGQNVTQMAQQLSQMARNVTELAQNVSQMQQDVVMEEPLHVDCHGERGEQFLPVEGGYILVEDSEPTVPEATDLDAIEREMERLDEILRSNGIVVTTDTSAPGTPESSNSKTSSTEQTKTSSTEQESTKLYPIFSNPNPGTTAPKASEKPNKKSVLKTGSDQYVIDAGQKKFGATQCNECGVIYQIGDPQDEHDHLVHHNATDVLKFSGLKDEYIVGRAGNARCIRIRGGDPGWKKVEQILDRVVHPQLGFGSGLMRDRLNYTAYIYVAKREIIGCLVCEPKIKAYKMIPGDADTPDCCSVETYPVKCGISRIWTHPSYRRRGLASRLLDCARASFLHGTGLTLDDIAFSAPTVYGKRLATAYSQRNDFYVYVD